MFPHVPWILEKVPYETRRFFNPQMLLTFLCTVVFTPLVSQQKVAHRFPGEIYVRTSCVYIYICVTIDMYVYVYIYVKDICTVYVSVIFSRWLHCSKKSFWIAVFGVKTIRRHVLRIKISQFIWELGSYQMCPSNLKEIPPCFPWSAMIKVARLLARVYERRKKKTLRIRCHVNWQQNP